MSQLRLPASVIIIAAAFGIGSPAAAETVTGRASVMDGDTLEIRGQRFRLQGVDTPESAQQCGDGAGKDYACGRKAALSLADKIGQGNVACEAIEKDRYGRTVAVCQHGALDLNGWLVEEGLGMAYRRYSTAYIGQEDAAKQAKRGIWAGRFTAPWDWRKGVREMDMGMAAPGGPDQPIPSPKTPSATATDACAIKGNISRKGDRIYHVPGTRDYERTQIDEASGERMFCSEGEARAAGWR